MIEILIAFPSNIIIPTFYELFVTIPKKWKNFSFFTMHFSQFWGIFIMKRTCLAEKLRKKYIYGIFFKVRKRLKSQRISHENSSNSLTSHFCQKEYENKQAIYEFFKNHL